MTDYEFGTGMTDAEIESFLRERGIGVLSLSRDGRAYAVPVSFAYDEEYHRCLLDLGFGPESKKRTFIETTEIACLTAYEWHSPSEWQSVVLTGLLRPLEEPLDRSYETLFYEHAKEIEITVFDLPPEEIDLEWYEFVVREQSGRSSP
ncbi:pyridoxamine 5'-phosphate oxidase family protein [Natrialbaceae archaeon AArc-T1-2]|uniref:pyridoxamine 5'-phosphate oxidase family protein n=1 Tax=Natrialbaceae archaeon AArc-T1-2 TaxID=3053904 RepID=UPI00255ABAE4|nr:pyridoxamine 5'-phosphate oxidase family protein [Natrialbaceae archaeon AArc-T1-2]WIV68506.1 pyridoxamine 5'-phosphate oxidase family protein [Natrialbaceae archaeon AArc-T1-2]